MNFPPRIALALALVGAVALAVGAALLTIGGPGTARLEKLDARRTDDLVELVAAIERHRKREDRLPESLEDLPGQVLGASGAPAGRSPLRDPETGDPYAYDAMGEDSFRLCTRLSLPEAQPRRPGRIGSRDARFTTSVMPDDEGGHRLCIEPAEPER